VKTKAVDESKLDDSPGYNCWNCLGLHLLCNKGLLGFREEVTGRLNFFFTAMLVSSDAFGDAVREVYEPEWPGQDKLIQYLEVCDQEVVISQGLWVLILL